MNAQSTCRIPLLLVLTVVLSSPMAFAQSASVKTDVQRDVDALREYRNQRLNFVKEYYALDAAKSAEIEGWLDSLIPQQKAYDDLNALTLRRRERVLSSMLSQLTTASQETKNQIASRIQDQIYAIHAAAPMSLSNVAKKTESILSPDSVELGRKLIVTKFPHVFTSGTFLVDRLDRVIIPPIKVGAASDPFTVANAARTPTAAKAAAQAEARSSGAEQLPASKASNRDVHSEAAQVEPSKATPPAMPAAPPVQPPVDTKPAPPKPLPPAPPVVEWPEKTGLTMSTFGFTAEQRARAEEILKSCTSRAQAHLESNKAEIERANQLTEEATRLKKLRSLTKEVDKIYSELVARVDSLASAEQREKAGAKPD